MYLFIACMYFRIYFLDSKDLRYTQLYASFLEDRKNIIMSGILAVFRLYYIF